MHVEPAKSLPAGRHLLALRAVTNQIMLSVPVEDEAGLWFCLVSAQHECNKPPSKGVLHMLGCALSSIACCNKLPSKGVLHMLGCALSPFACCNSRHPLHMNCSGPAHFGVTNRTVVFGYMASSH